MKILITGASGFIGTSFIEFLQSKEDIHIYAHGRNFDAIREKFKALRVTVVSEYSQALMDSWGIDCIIHLAGIAHDLAGKFATQDYQKVNFGLTADLYSEFLKSKATSFILMSSIKAAVDQSSKPVTELAIPSPVTDYGKSKREAEIFIENSPCPEGKRYYIFRPSMIYGHGNKGNLNVLYKFIRTGMPYPLGAYDNQRSFLYVENLNFVIEKFIRNQYPSGIYHLADNEVLSTTELVKSIAGTLGKRIAIWKLPRKLIRGIAATGSFFRLPFNSQTLLKLTESLVVSNRKVNDVIGVVLPFTTKNGLEATINSFHE